MHGKWDWKAMPWGMFTVCSVCGEGHYCYGRTRRLMVCLDCFSADPGSAKVRRGRKRTA